MSESKYLCWSVFMEAEVPSVSRKYKGYNERTKAGNLIEL
jgi:hypothetical protein